MLVSLSVSSEQPCVMKRSDIIYVQDYVTSPKVNASFLMFHTLSSGLLAKSKSLRLCQSLNLIHFISFLS